MTDDINNTPAQETAIETPVETAETSQATEAKSFMDLITDEELKASKSLSNFKDINGLAKSYINLEKKLGAPKEPESYTPEQYTYELPENYQANENILNPIKEKAIELGIKPEAFKALVETFTGKESEIMQQLEADKETQAKQLQETLKKEWGNEYDSKLDLADKTWQKFSNEQDDEVLSSLPQNVQLAIAKIMANVGSKIGESAVGKPSSIQIDPKTELDSIYSNPQHPYWQAGHSEHNNAVEKVKSLMSKIA